MSVYKVIQTGPNTQFGGLKDGFTKELYHVGMAEAVENEPIIPTELQITILIINFISSIDFI
jgi:hypothetical protein